MNRHVVMAICFCAAIGAAGLITMGRSLEVIPFPLAQFSDDDFSRAALKIVGPFGPSCGPSYLDGTVEQCDRATRSIDDLRMRYAAYEPTNLRRHIMSWLDFYQRRIDENRADVISGESRKSQENYRARIKKDADRAQELLDAIEIRRGAAP